MKARRCSSKSEIMDAVQRGEAHEAFTHEHLGTFDVTLMRDAASHGLYGDPGDSLAPELNPNKRA